MSRIVRVGAAQMGGISRNEPKESVVEKLLGQMRRAHGEGCDIVVFPELALTTYFARWLIEDEEELDRFCEADMPSPATRPLFDEAARLEIGFHLGYAELAVENGVKRRFNSSVLADKNGRIINRFRKIHLPGRVEPDPGFAAQALEKRYFEVGDTGYRTVRGFGGVMGVCICNDRRWAESYRVLALKGAEMIFIGYNTPTKPYWAHEEDPLSDFHNHLSMQAGAYQNCCWIVGVAKAGMEDGEELIGGTCIIAPTGEVVAACETREQELICADCDLDLARDLKDNLLNFEQHRRIEHYGLITGQRGVVEPD